MASKGDSKEPDVRARLVGCEVNKGGEKVDAFDASTPPEYVVLAILVRANPKGQALENQLRRHQKSLL